MSKGLIYLAARYSRRQELCGYRDQLAQADYHVTSSWLDGHHELFGVEKKTYDDQQTRDSLHSQKRQQFALEDLSDLMGAKILIAFTEEPRATKTRGGRHVEFGIALGLGLRLIVVGPKENVFYDLPGVEHFTEWQDCLARLEACDE